MNLVNPKRGKSAVYNGQGRGCYNGVRDGENTGVIRTGLLMLIKEVDGVLTDSIGLLITPEQVPTEYRSVFFDGEILRSPAEILSLALASPYLNRDYMIGTVEWGIALYAIDTPAATLKKARRIVKCLTFEGMTLFGDTREYGLPKTPKWYVDSGALGNDSNDGLSRPAPLKTITALMAKPILNGDCIGLAANSYWREEINAMLLTGLTFSGYGVGARPTLDAADIAINADFSLVGGTTNVYQISWTHAVYELEFLSVWENGVRLLYVADLATCKITPGSFTVTMPSTSPTAVMIHPFGSTNPTTDAKVYEISRRTAGILATGDGNSALHIHTKRNGGSNGSLVVGLDTNTFNCLVEDGTKHNLFFSSGIVANCALWKQDQSARTNQTLLIAYTNNGTGKTVKVKSCVAKASFYRVGVDGFYNHTSGPTQKYDRIDYEDCATDLCSNGFGGVDTTTIGFTRCRARNCYSGVAGIYNRVEVEDFFAESTANYTVSRGITVVASEYVHVDGMRYTVKNSNTGGIYVNTPELVVNNSVFHRIAGGTGYAISIRHYSAGTYSASGNIFSVLDSSHYSGHASSSIVAADNNVFSFAAMDVLVANVAYNDVAAYRTAYPALDVNSVIGDPLFVDPANGNFNLQAGSPAIAIGAGLLRPDVEFMAIPSDDVLAAM